MGSDQHETTGQGREQLSADTVFELLANSRRRETLNYLREAGETTLRELSTHIAAAENDVDVSDLTAVQRKRVSIGLYQCHLPKLQRTGVVEYDRSRGTISRTELASALDPGLALADDFDNASVESTSHR